MSVLAGLLAGVSVLLALPPRNATRLRRALPPASQPGGRPRSPLPFPVVAGVVAGVAVALLLPFPLGPLSGVATALALPRVVRRLEPRAARAERERLLADLPLLLDLLAACLAGGAPLGAAAAAVGAAVPGPGGRRLEAVSAALRVGSPPVEAWAALAGPDAADPLLPAAQALARAADGGAPVAAAVTRLAAEARADARGRGERAARRVGVQAAGPLGLCFLPAFVLLGIVPVVAGLAGPLLATL